MLEPLDDSVLWNIYEEEDCPSNSNRFYYYIILVVLSVNVEVIVAF